jgi:hypothetical protein
VLFLGLALVRGLIYAAAIPPWQSPDENGHFEYAWQITRLGRLPPHEYVSSAFDRELLGSLYEWRYGQFIGRPLPGQMPTGIDDLPLEIFARSSRPVGRRFSLAYIWMAIFIWPFRHQDLVVQLYVARFSSVLLELGIIWLAWRIFEEALPRQRWLVVAMTAFVLFLPQHTFINACVGEGPLAELAACVVLYGWLRLFRRGIRAGGIVAVVGGTLVGLWAKKTAAFLLPFDGLAMALLLTVRLQSPARRKQLAYLALLGLTLLVLLGWTGLQMPVGRSVLRRLGHWWSDPQLYLETEWMSLDQALKGTFDSFWARFGWMAVGPDPWWYALVYLLTMWVVEGWVLPRTSRWVVSSQVKILLGGALLLALTVWFAFVISTPRGLAYSQGRYLFPMTVPAAFFLVMGWARWMPERWQRYFATSVVILLAALDAAAACLALWPYFYAW